MDRSRATRALGAIITLLPAILALVLVAALSALPPVALEQTSLAWLLGALGAALVAAAGVAGLAALVVGLRLGDLAALMRAGSSATLAGAGAVVVANAASIAVPLLLAAAFLVAGAFTVRVPPLRERSSAIAVAIVALVLAETAALAEVLPTPLVLLAPLDLPILATAVALSILLVLVSPGRRAVAALLAVGAVGLLTDRAGSLESVVGLAALIAGQLVALGEAVVRADDAAEADEARLPELAAQLSDAILRFDGRLRLRDWNAAAASLLGLDAISTGTRLEDVLGVSIAELPGHDTPVLSRHAVAGLEIAMHRSGFGVTAIIRDPGATPEADRLGNELRSTIEELLRARRTIDLQRDELERSATVDALTGVASRGAILERLRLEVAQARRYQHPLALVLLDIDGFGELNRLHGLAAGDTVLREVALRIRLRVRDADALGRLGSDRFIAALPHTDEAGAATFADALRRRLATRPIALGETSVAVTVSVGVATMRAGEELDLDGLLGRVDEALASARSAGGDRIALDRVHGLARLEDRHQNEPPGAAGDG